MKVAGHVPTRRMCLVAPVHVCSCPPPPQLQDEQITGHWSEVERKAFMELFLQYPKDFRRIALQLPGRTSGDCVAFFYKHQKLDEFANVRRKQQLKKRKVRGGRAARRGNAPKWGRTSQRPQL